MQVQGKPLVRSIKEKCRVCYTCVRECPAKAIRIAGGQAEVMPERCIGCGNCVRVCSQNAKEVLSSKDKVLELLNSAYRVSAIVAPSFPAEFENTDYKLVVGMLRKMGFDLVNEVAFGADLVGQAYNKLLKENNNNKYITTSCPAVVAYIQQYYPNIVSNLIPVVSPMIAAARALKKLYGDDLRIVFIGPCIAKKGEADDSNVRGEVDAVLTFSELKAMLIEKDIFKESVTPSDFDGPLGGRGRIFPVARGMLEAAAIKEDIVDGRVVASDGRGNTLEAVKEFSHGLLNFRLLELLCCEGGCIMGAGISEKLPIFRRRELVSSYARGRMNGPDRGLETEDLSEWAAFDLSREFTAVDQRMPTPEEKEIREILNNMGKYSYEDELNCGACGYETCREHAIAIHKGLAESEMCLPYTIDRLKDTVRELETSHIKLADAKQALVQSEKLASMGQLAAGIAHEVNNPLGIILMYANLLLEKCADNELMKEDMTMIACQAERCRKIVSGLLNFARQNKTLRQPVDINELIRETIVTLSLPDNVSVTIKKNSEKPVAEVDRDQIAQVLINLLTNASDAIIGPDGCITIETMDMDKQITVRIIDNGVGIPEEKQSRIFDPFYTTKPVGRGTGLGLAVVYGIIKMHRGDIKVTSNTDSKKGETGTVFEVLIPKK
ncbi:MAG: [Fe-Fe] hydrogenase large subunit C-terminal domain-containing protein [Candidatus Margulisiibacteriota bacterium]